MKLPSIHFVHNRKRIADKKVRTPIELRVTYARKSVYITSGYTCLAKNWDSHNECAKGGSDIIAVNTALQTMRHRAYTIAAEMLARKDMNIALLARMMREGDTESVSFISYVESRIKCREDIRESTRKAHNKLIVSLREYGKIVTFSDLTHANIQDYYDWLLRRGNGKGGKMRQSSVWSHMKVLRTYIHDAMRSGLLKEDASVGIRVPHGSAAPGRWLSAEELRKMEKADLDGSPCRVRDLFLMQCYSGLAYSDLMDFSADKIEESDGLRLLSGRRKKTDEEYLLVVLPELDALLSRYGYKIPQISVQKYNEYLKALACRLGIDKPLSSHWGRRTFGMLMLNRGYPIEVVARALGHADIRVTQQAYARLLRDGVVDSYKRLQKKR